MQSNNYTQRQYSLDDLLKIVHHLMSGKKVVMIGNEIRVGNKGSLSIKEPGQYYNHEAGQGGSIISLIMRTLLCDFKTATEWCGNLASAPTPVHKQYGAKPANNKERTARALKIWYDAKNIKGTLGEQYFRNRSITIDLPDSLRFHHGMWHPSGNHYSAVVAAVFDVDKRFKGVHVIYLDPRTGQKITDARAKISIGRISGGAVALAPLQSTLVICEGIEDGLSYMQMYPDPEVTVWACLGTAGLGNVEIPSSVKEVIIAADNDNAGLKAAQSKKKKLAYLGFKTHTAIPKNCNDFNDLLRRAI